jgi:hypothetical protein
MKETESDRKPFVPPKLERLDDLVQTTGVDLPPLES